MSPPVARRRHACGAAALFLCLATGTAWSQTPVEAVLPPLQEWHGASAALVLPADDAWATPCEQAGLMASASLEDTATWLEKLAAAAPQVRLTSIGRSHHGRDIPMVIVSRDGARTPAALAATGRPLALIHGGIHAGEIDGKDAGLMLLRDMTVGGSRSGLLDTVNVLFIPVLNVDGHERASPHGRINQRGPEISGWRSNARNQNLNRDFAKLDTPEVRALVQVISHWQPDLYVDVHVTDGLDYQYDITWGYNGRQAHSPATAAWMDEHLTPTASRALVAQGHIPGPLIFAVDQDDLSQGLVGWTADPRFSNGYGDARHLATVLVENHSLKPFRQRVLGTRVLLESFLDTLGRHGEMLRQAAAADAARRLPAVPLAWKVGGPPQSFTLRGIEQRFVDSPISGGPVVQWTGKPVTLEVPWLERHGVAATAVAPAAYWIPPTWPRVIERLAWHGIRMETLTAPRTLEVEMYRLHGAALKPEPLEGHPQVVAEPVPESMTWTFPPGAVRVPVDQPLGTLAILLLEPASPDSFFQWGFFLEVLQRVEYVEAYVMEPTARRMLEANPTLEAEFHAALAADPDLAASPVERLQWFYRRTPWYDQRENLYPVAREMPAPD